MAPTLTLVYICDCFKESLSYKCTFEARPNVIKLRIDPPIENDPEQVRDILWKEISTISQSASIYAVNPQSDFTRNRKLNLETLMRFLISIQSGTTAHELLKFFDYSTDTITNSGFIQQREKLLPEAFQQLLYQFNMLFSY